MLAEKFRKITNEALKKAEIVAEKRRKEEIAAAKIQRRKDVERAKKIYPSVIEAIERKAALGETNHSIPIYQWKDSHKEGKNEEAFCDTLEKLLKKDGFVVDRDYSRDEPCGSDSYFPSTVYSLHLTVYWNGMD